MRYGRQQLPHSRMESGTMPKKYSRLPYKLVIRGQIYHLKISTVVNGQRILIRESTHTADRKEAEQYAAKRFAQVVENAEYRTNPNKLKDFTLLSSKVNINNSENTPVIANQINTATISDFPQVFRPHLQHR